MKPFPLARIDRETKPVHPDPSAGQRIPTDERLDAGALYRDHCAFVARFMCRLGVAREDLDDLLQEVFMIVHLRGGFVPGPARSTTWLAEITLRVVAARRRRLRRRDEPLEDARLDALAAPGLLAVDRLELVETFRRVDRALDCLPLRHRAVFVLYEIDGESCESIAAGLDLPVGTIHSRLHHARAKFTRSYARLLAGERKRERP